MKNVIIKVTFCSVGLFGLICGSNNPTPLIPTVNQPNLEALQSAIKNNESKIEALYKPKLEKDKAEEKKQKDEAEEKRAMRRSSPLIQTAKELADLAKSTYAKKAEIKKLAEEEDAAERNRKKAKEMQAIAERYKPKFEQLQEIIKNNESKLEDLYKQKLEKEIDLKKTQETIASYEGIHAQRAQQNLESPSSWKTWFNTSWLGQTLGGDYATAIKKLKKQITDEEIGVDNANKQLEAAKNNQTQLIAQRTNLEETKKQEEALVEKAAIDAQGSPSYLSRAFGGIRNKLQSLKDSMPSAPSADEVNANIARDIGVAKAIGENIATKTSNAMQGAQELAYKVAKGTKELAVGGAQKVATLANVEANAQGAQELAHKVAKGARELVVAGAQNVAKLANYVADQSEGYRKLQERIEQDADNQTAQQIAQLKQEAAERIAAEQARADQLAQEKAAFEIAAAQQREQIKQEAAEKIAAEQAKAAQQIEEARIAAEKNTLWNQTQEAMNNLWASTKAAGSSVTNFVYEKPWQTVGIAVAATGLAVAAKWAYAYLTSGASAETFYNEQKTKNDALIQNMQKDLQLAQAKYLDVLKMLDPVLLQQNTMLSRRAILLESIKQKLEALEEQEDLSQSQITLKTRYQRIMDKLTNDPEITRVLARNEELNSKLSQLNISIIAIADLVAKFNEGLIQADNRLVNIAQIQAEINNLNKVVETIQAQFNG